MSVVGIDFGTLNCTIAAAQKGGVDILADEVSSRQTPNMVGFTDKERVIGQAALTQYTRNPRNTLSNLKLLLGRRWSEREVHDELKRLPFKAVEMPGDAIGVQVMYGGETKVFSVVALVGMMLYKLRETAAAALNKEVRDVVISVPAYWTEQQRRAMLDAAHVAGLNCLRLIQDNTASALGYGLFKRDVPAGDEANPAALAAFFDMGYVQTSVSIMAMSQGKLRTVSAAFDRQLGGRDFDRLIVEHAAAEIQAKYKLDVLSNARATMRLEQACEKVKKQLNMNSDVPLSIDSLMNDVDVKLMITRQQFELMCQPLLHRMLEPLRRALESAGVGVDKLASFEITGGSTRLTVVQAALTEFLRAGGHQHGLSHTLNHEESVAKGCALQCAILSPLFRLQREYLVHDITSYPVRLTWGPATAGSRPGDAMDTADGTESLELPAGTMFPTGKKLTMLRRDPLQVVASYLPSPLLPSDTPSELGRWLADVKLPEGVTEPVKLTLTVRFELHGTIGVDSAQLSIPLPEESQPAPPADAAAAPVAADAAPADAPPATGEPQPAAADDKAANSQQQQAPAAKKTKRVRHQAVSITESSAATLGNKELEALREDEGRMQAADRLARETADTKNLVEGYVYDTRSKLSDGGEWAAFASAAERDALMQLLDRTESWLYDDGADQTKSVYSSKLHELQALGDPIKRRRWEADNRYDAVTQLRAAIQRLSADASSTDVKYEHIEPTDRQKVLAETAKADQALNDALAKQEAAPKSQNAHLTVQELLKRKHDLTAFCEAILNKPKPKPVEKPAEKPSEKPAEQKTENETTQDSQPEKQEEKTEGADDARKDSPAATADSGAPSAMDLD
eukprot:TRINITY_DN4232_c0_g1_i2.p1 TRINITY_DN4232_c0_g1~~TRINITY_DN4232_c0_g1_i2.p1  ORF type:complete len:854 (+),score=362.08 TRINITY_DN4232_c0_g1_i2:164-2725(+)